MSAHRLLRFTMLFAALSMAACVEEAPPGIPGPPAPPEIEAECVGALIDDTMTSPSAGGAPETPTEVGAAAPTWFLSDEQPLSCNHQKIYGLPQYRGTPTMVVLLWSGCSFCQSQTEWLHKMKGELDDENVAVNFAIINRADGSNSVLNLSNRCTFPVFQDTDGVNAWGLHQGTKDDFYFYDADGVLQQFISARGELEINLATAEGYANIKNAVLALVQ